MHQYANEWQQVKHIIIIFIKSCQNATHAQINNILYTVSSIEMSEVLCLVNFPELLCAVF